MKIVLKKLIIIVCCVFCLTGCSYFQLSYILRARRQMDKFNYVRAVELLNKCDSATLHSTDVLSLRASLLYDLGLYDACMTDLDEIFSSGNAGYNEYSIKARIFKYRGQYEEAMNVYSDMKKIGMMDVDYYYSIGYCQEKMGNLEDALENYSQFLSSCNSDSYAFLRRGCLYLRLNRKEEAEQNFLKVLEMDTNADLFSHREYALFYLGRKEEAYDWVDRLKAFDSYDPTFDYDNACLLSLDNRFEESLEALETCFEKGFYNFDLIRENVELDPLRKDPRFDELVMKYQKIRKKRIQQLSSELGLLSL